MSFLSSIFNSGATHSLGICEAGTSELAGGTSHHTVRTTASVQSEVPGPILVAAPGNDIGDALRLSTVACYETEAGKHITFDLEKGRV